jgi:hypothetical protein
MFSLASFQFDSTSSLDVPLDARSCAEWRGKTKHSTFGRMDRTQKMVFIEPRLCGAFMHALSQHGGTFVR